MIVLDASAGVELLRWSSAGQRVAETLADERQTVHVPHLFAIEVTQVLRRLTLQGSVDAVRAEEAIADLGDLDLVRHEHEILLGRVWSLRHVLTAYDAVYVALAEVLGAPLFTLDGRMAATAQGLVEVELIG